MKPFEEQYTAWVDGQLTGPELADFEARLADRSEAEADRLGVARLGRLLREHGGAPELSHAEFFHHQLRARIAADAASTRAVEKPARGWWAWLGALPRTAWAGAFCVALAFALYQSIVKPAGGPGAPMEGPYVAQVLRAEAADATLSVTPLYSKDDEMTVLWIDGMDYLPASYQLQ